MPVGTTVKRLDVSHGDVVEIHGRRYEMLADGEGGFAMEPAITTGASELRAQRGGQGLTAAEFDELFGDLPSDGEG